MKGSSHARAVILAIIAAYCLEKYSTYLHRPFPCHCPHALQSQKKWAHPLLRRLAQVFPRCLAFARQGGGQRRQAHVCCAAGSVGRLEARYETHVRDRAFQLWPLPAEPAGHCGLKYAAGYTPGALLIPYYTLVQGPRGDMKSTANPTPLSTDG
jgi:hypothetical protein